MATTTPSPAAIALAPLALRIVLGSLFLWAGLVKWCATAPVSGEDAAILANMSLLDRPAGAAPPLSPAAPPTQPSAPLPAPGKPAAATGGTPLLLAQTTPAPAQSSPPPPVSSGPALATAADFPEPVPCRMVWMLALSLHHASHPASGKMALWPRSLGDGIWPKCAAIAVLIVELIGGACVLIGLCTRLSALGIACVMLGALWLTQIGPAMQSGAAVLGFIPAHGWKDGAAWQTLIVQALALSSSLALVFLGSGALAFDRALAGYRSAAARPEPRPAPSGGPGGR